MKYLILLSCFILSTTTFALSCPNGHILVSGKLEEVLQRCGSPISKNEYTKNGNTAQQWEYYKLSKNNTNNKIVIVFNNDRIVNIQVINSNSTMKQNLTSSNLCGRVINLKDNQAQVQAACGNPIQIQNSSTLVTELTYTGSQQNTMVFENGNFVAWK